VKPPHFCVGSRHINIDDFWLHDSQQDPLSQQDSQVVDAFGRRTYDTSRFPNGIADVAKHVHHNGQKVGIYLQTGIPTAAVHLNTPIEGTQCHAQDIITQPVKNGSAFTWLKNTDQIDFSQPCAQGYINSEVNLLVSWGIDFLKLDGVAPGSNLYDGSIDARPELKAWAQALAGKNIWLELSWSLDVRDISTWQRYSNGWRITGDIECSLEASCDTLTNWDYVTMRFQQIVPWIKYTRPGGWNDLDALDVGNGAMDGLTDNERQSYMTFWAIEAAPLYTGDDLTKLDIYGLQLLTNKEVIAVDQQGKPAKPVSLSSNQQVWYTRNNDGSYTVALFNLDSSSAQVTANWSDVGFSGSASVRDLWSHRTIGNFNGSLSLTLNGHGSRLLKVVPSN